MVTTRKATGSLPTPKRKSVADVDSDDDEYSSEVASEEEIDERPVVKRARKEQSVALKGQPESSKGQLSPSDDDGEQTGLWNDGIYSDLPRSRMDSLITGENSKSELAKSGAAPKILKKARRLRKDDLGKLSRMMDLSVEVFCEIASYLTPIDLLQLSRASRPLREFLLSRSSRAIWVACLAATGIPPCPPDMSEPQYANLYFEKECHACGYPRVERQTGHLRIRLCRGCSKLNVVQGKELVKHYFKADVSRMFEIYSLLPWNNLDEYDTNSLKTISSKNQNRYFLKYDFLEVVKAYLQTKPDSEERKSFVEKRHELVQNIAKSVRDVASWLQRRYRDRFVADEEVCKKREEQIKEKLYGLGYSHEEIESLRNLPFNDPNQMRLKWIQIVHQPRELTDRIWKSNRPRLEELIRSKRKFDKQQVIEGNRDKRKSELSPLYYEWAIRNQMDKTDVAPLSFTELCMIPAVEEMIEEDDCEIEITQERWRHIEEKLPEFWSKHAKKVERDCLDTLITRFSTPGDTEPGLSDSELGVEGVGSDPSILRRAYVFFSKWPLHREITTYAGHLSFLRELSFGETVAAAHLMSWDKKKLPVSTTATRAANALLSSLSLPKETTMQQMQDMGQVFVCQQCDAILRKRMVWKELVQHVFEDVTNYNRAKALRTGWVWPLLIQVKLLETHKVAADEVGAPLVVVDADFTGPSVESFTYINEAVDGTHAEEPCSSCQSLIIHRPFLYKEQLAAHTRAYHGADAEPE